MSDSDTDEIEEDKVNIPRALLEGAFKRGFDKNGAAYFDKLKHLISEDVVLEEDRDSILQALSEWTDFENKNGATKISASLDELEIWEISKENSRRIGFLAYLAENQSPTNSFNPSQLPRRESSGSGILSHSHSDEYEDDFEDDIDNEELDARRRARRKAENNSSRNSHHVSSSEYGSREYNDIKEESLDSDSVNELQPSFRSSPENEFGSGRYKADSFEEDYEDDSDDIEEEEGKGNEPFYDEVEVEDEYQSRYNNEKKFPRAPSAPARRTSSNVRENSSSSAVSNSRASSAAGVRKKPQTASWIRDHKWVLGEKIGSGSFGDVFQGMNETTGGLFAVKRLHIAGQRNVVDTLANEIQLMRDYAHPNIVGYLGAEVDEKEGVVHIFSEWVPGGSLAHVLKHFGTFKDSVVASYTRQILLGLQFLHANGIIHRDIKGGNVLVDESGTVKLADFGASTQVNSFDQTQETTSMQGTPYFMAPEVLSRSKYGRKGDIWAVGCTMIQMLTGQPPWKDHELKGLVQLHMLLSTWEGPPKYPAEKVSRECQECIESCFKKSATERPTAQELLQCSYLKPKNEGDTPSDFESRKFDDFNKEIDETLEDSGVMTGLRMQMARLAQSTETLVDIRTTPRNIDRSTNDVSRSADTVEGMKKEIERRRIVKESQDVSRLKSRDIHDSEDKSRNSDHLDFQNFTRVPPSDESVMQVSSTEEKTVKRVNPYARLSSNNLPSEVNGSTSIAPDNKLMEEPKKNVNPYARSAGLGKLNNPCIKAPKIHTANNFVREINKRVISANVSSARDSEGLTPLQADDSPSIHISPPSKEEIDEEGQQIWKCLACGAENTDNFGCQACATTKGSSGRKSLNDPLTRR